MEDFGRPQFVVQIRPLTNFSKILSFLNDFLPSEVVYQNKKCCNKNTLIKYTLYSM